MQRKERHQQAWLTQRQRENRIRNKNTRTITITNKGAQWSARVWLITARNGICLMLANENGTYVHQGAMKIIFERAAAYMVSQKYGMVYLIFFQHRIPRFRQAVVPNYLSSTRTWVWWTSRDPCLKQRMLKRKNMSVWIIFGSKLLSSFSMSAMYSFDPVLHREPFFDPLRPFFGVATHISRTTG